MNNFITHLFQRTQFYFRYHSRFILFLLSESIFYTSLFIGYLFGFNSIWSLDIQTDFLRFIFNSLLSINLIFFSLSFTAYTLAIKLTQKYTLNKWVIEGINIRRTVIFFIIKILIYIGSFSFIVSSKIASNLWFEILGIFIPSMVLMITSLFIVLKTIDITSPKEIIRNFLAPKIQREKFKFNYQMQQVLISKASIPDPFKSILGSNMIKVIAASKIFKSMASLVSKTIDDALNTLIEIEGVRIPTETEIPTLIGLSCAPPYIEQEFTRDNLIIKIKGMIEKSPDSNYRFSSFINGFIEGLLQNNFIDTNILGSVEYLITLIRDIGYKGLGSHQDNAIFDLTNNILFEIAKQISRIKNKLLNESENIIFNRIINRIANIYSEYETTNPFIIGILMRRIVDLTVLDLDLQAKGSCIERIVDLTRKIASKQDWGLSGVYLFSIMQMIWKNLLSEKIIRADINKTQSDSKIRSIVFKIILENLDKLINLTIKYPKSEESIKVSPILFNMNRIFIDLIYYIADIYRTSQDNDIKMFCKKLFGEIFKIHLKMIKGILEKAPAINIKNLIVSPCIVGIIGIEQNILLNSEFLDLLQEKDLVNISIIFGVHLIYENIHQEHLSKVQELSHLLLPYLDDLMKNFSLEESENEFASEFPDREFYQIETLQGNWLIEGHLIGNFILRVINILADQKLIRGFLEIIKINENKKHTNLMENKKLNKKNSKK